VWESEAVLKVLESLHFDAERKLLYVSNIDGKPTESRTADFGWDPKTKTVHLPTFFSNSVIAYRVE
jgi:hypothetical protein